MSEPIDLEPIKEKLTTNEPIFILFGQNATIDHVGSALALFLSLKAAKKDVLVASPSEMRAEFTYLVGLDKIGKSIGNRNLVISFKDYTSGSIERVSHNDDINNKFELTIQPKSGHKAPNPKDIDYSYTGAAADLIFILGTSRLEDLGSIYESERTLFNSATTVAINRRQNMSYANINIIDEQASSLAEITAELIDKLGLSLHRDISSNLMAALDFATNRFQNPVISSNAFAVAGKLIENGGKRPPQRLSAAPGMTGFSTRSPFAAPPSFGDNSPFAQALSRTGVNLPPAPGVFTAPPPQPAPAPQAMPPASTPTFQPSPDQANTSNTAPASQSIISSPSAAPPEPQSSLDPAPDSVSDPANQPSPEDQPPPADWTQPKIYKGSTRV